MVKNRQHRLFTTDPGYRKKPLEPGYASYVSAFASWNFRHIVGATERRNIEFALIEVEVYAPVIATPEEILESLE